MWDGDTVVAITKPQLIKINRSLNDYGHLKSINLNLKREIAVVDSLRFYWEQVAQTTDTLYFMEVRKYEQLDNVNKSLQVALKDEKKKSRQIGIGVGVGGTLLGILLGALLIR